MNVKPVDHYRNAAYPDRPTAEKQPKLLASIPNRWQKKPLVLAALSSLVGITAACRTNPNQSNEGGKQSKPVSLVAPLFIHGEGRGAFGCEAVNPPVFLSEAEAREVIAEEAKKAGIRFKSGGSEFAGATMHAYPPKGKEKTENIAADGNDASHGISFVLVSETRAEQWTQPSQSSVSSFDSKGLAGKVVAELKKAKPTQVVGTFYEPFARAKWEKDWRQTEAKGKALDREELRQQVRDFVKWLKTNGVI